MATIVDGRTMRKAHKKAKSMLPDGWGATLLVYPLGSNDGLANYVSDGRREDMIKFLKETIKRFEGGNDFPTPESN
jgi:hypothetical protein